MDPASPTAVTMVPALRFWLVAWYAILVLGILGLTGAVLSGRQFGWRNRNEVLRGLGTVFAAAGMLLLLEGLWPDAAQAALAFGVLCFGGALLLERRRGARPAAAVPHLRLERSEPGAPRGVPEPVRSAPPR